MINILKHKKWLRLCFFSIISLSVVYQVRSQECFVQCSLVDNSHDALFITYQRTTKVKADDGQLNDGVVLRLHNNSTCTFIITTGSAEKFLKPLPDNPSVSQRIRREIEYDLPDGQLVPDVQYRHITSHGSGFNINGDVFYGFRLVAKRSILFEVPLKHFDSKLDGRIELIFQYAWERQNRAINNYPSVENIVRFSPNELPSVLKRKIQEAK